MSSYCNLVINPDVSGAGVRAAIYTQNILCFVPAIWAIEDGTVSDYELESADTHSTTNLVLAFAILICSVFQGASRELTNYHAAIVLNLSWMNNTNAFIYFLLYVQCKTQGERGARIEPGLSAWGAHIKARAKTIFCLPDGLSVRLIPRPHSQARVSTDPRQKKRGPDSTVREAFKVLFKRVALLLGSLHLTLMAVAGCAAEVVDLAIVGGHVRFGSPVLRGLSLALYSIFLLPGLNLLLPTLPFLALHCWYHGPLQLPPPATAPGRSGSQMVPLLEVQATRVSSEEPHQTREELIVRLRRVVPVIVGLVFLLIVNVIFITDVELTLRRNAHLQDGNESDWGFGQILAMLLVFMPLRDLIEAIFRRRQEMQTRLDNALAEAINKKDMQAISGWVRVGANVLVQGDKGETALHFVSSDKGHNGLVADLMERGADPSLESDGLTAFEKAYLAQNEEAVAIMAGVELSPNETIFEAAARKKNWDLFRALSSHNSDFNKPRLHGGAVAVLGVAVENGDWDGVRVLVQLGVDINAMERIAGKN